jgi:hypothetical protein
VKKLAPILAIMLLALAFGAPAAPAKKAIKGSITLKMGEPDFFGAEASGKIKTKKICADLRAVRVKLLHPPDGYRQSGPIYGNRDKTYGEVVPVPDEPGTYSFRAKAKKTRVARGLKRAKCAKLKSPVVSVTVTPEPL